MATSLYDIGIKTYLQILPAVGGFLENHRLRAGSASRS